MKRSKKTGSGNGYRTGTSNFNSFANTNNENTGQDNEREWGKKCRIESPQDLPRASVESRIPNPAATNVLQAFRNPAATEALPRTPPPSDQQKLDASVPVLNPVAWLPPDVAGIIRSRLDIPTQRNWRLVDKAALALFDENFPEIKDDIRLESFDRYLDSQWPSNGSRLYQRNTNIHGIPAVTCQPEGPLNKRLKFKANEFEGLVAKIKDSNFVSSHNKAKLLIKMQLGIPRILVGAKRSGTKAWLKAIDALDEVDFVTAFPAVLWRHDQNSHTPTPRTRFLQLQHRLRNLSVESSGRLFMTLLQKPWELESVFFHLISHIEQVPASVLPDILARYWQVPWQLGMLVGDIAYGRAPSLEEQWEARWKIFADALQRVAKDSIFQVLREAVAATLRIPPERGIRVRFLNQVRSIMEKRGLDTDQMEAQCKIVLAACRTAWPSDKDKALVRQLNLYIPGKAYKPVLARTEIDKWILAVDNPDIRRNNLDTAPLTTFLIDLANSSKPASSAVGMEMLQKFEASCQTGSFASHLLAFQGTPGELREVLKVLSEFWKTAGMEDAKS